MNYKVSYAIFISCYLKITVVTKLILKKKNVYINEIV